MPLRPHQTAADITAFLTNMEQRLTQHIISNQAIQDQKNAAYEREFSDLNTRHDRFEDKLDTLGEKLDKVSNSVDNRAKTDEELRTRRKDLFAMLVALTTLVGFLFVLVDRGVI